MSDIKVGDRVVAHSHIQDSLFNDKAGTVLEVNDTERDGWPIWVLLDDPPIAPSDVDIPDWDGGFGFRPSELEPLA